VNGICNTPTTKWCVCVAWIYRLGDIFTVVRLGDMLCGKKIDQFVIFKLSFKRRVQLRAQFAQSEAALVEDIVEQLRYARSAYPYYFRNPLYEGVNQLHDAVVRAIMYVYFPSQGADSVTWEDLIDQRIFRNPGSPTWRRSDPWRRANRRTDVEEVIRLNSDHNAYRPPAKESKKEETLDPADYGFE